MRELYELLSLALFMAGLVVYGAIFWFLGGTKLAGAIFMASGSAWTYILEAHDSLVLHLPVDPQTPTRLYIASLIVAAVLGWSVRPPYAIWITLISFFITFCLGGTLAGLLYGGAWILHIDTPDWVASDSIGALFWGASYLFFAALLSIDAVLHHSDDSEAPLGPIKYATTVWKSLPSNPFIVVLSLIIGLAGFIAGIVGLSH